MPGAVGRSLGFTVLTVILWLFMGLRVPFGYITKLIEVALIALLALERRRGRIGTRSSQKPGFYLVV